MSRFALICALLTGLFLTIPVFAEVIHVPDDQETIQAGLDAAEDGDTVLVAAGEYAGEGNVNLDVSQEITLLSEDGPEETIIDCEDAENVRGIQITATAVVSGFTVMRSAFIGVWIQNANDVLIDNCFITGNNNEVDDEQGAGLVFRQSSGTVQHCIIDMNRTLESGAGIYGDVSEIFVYNCIIASNQSERFGGGVLFTGAAESEITNSIIQENVCGIDGGGVAVSRGMTGRIQNCDFLDNAAGEDNGFGGGLYVGSDSQPIVRDCIFWGNEAPDGPQIRVQNGELDISHSCVEGGVDEDAQWNGEEIIDDEPLLVNGRNPLWGWNGYWLDEDSPCIDAGSAPAEDLGMDTLMTDVNLLADEEAVDLGFHYWIGNFAIVGTLTGSVIDLATEEAIEGARITTSNGQSTESDEEGLWVIEDAFANVFDITCEAEGYITETMEGLELEEDEELEVNFEMARPIFTPSVENLAVELEQGEQADLDFQVENTGNGRLEYSAETNLAEGAAFEPWEMRHSYPIGGVVGDDRIYGAVYIDGLFYLSGGDNDPNMIYVFDLEGEPVDEFEQPGEARYGMRDLTWDGEAIWGSGERTVYGVDLEGNVVGQFEGPANPTVGITWDPEHNMFWAAGTANDITGFNADGEPTGAEIDRGELRIYGLAYWEDDPDDYNLYVHCSTADDQRQLVYKINVEEGEQFGDMMFLIALEPEEEADPEGCYITDLLDPFSVVFMTVADDRDGNDRLELWQLDVNDDWMQIDPTEGTIDPDEAEDFILTLNSEGFGDGDYEGVIEFTHNAAEGMSQIPFTMTVVGGGGGEERADRNLDLSNGWNLVSVNVVPDDDDIVALMNPLVQDDLLIIIKDYLGRFYLPQFDFNNIPGWVYSEGYWMKLEEDARLQISGVVVPPDEPIQMIVGWQNIAYFPNVPVDAEVAMAGIVDELIIAKDQEGHFYVPEFEFNSIGDCLPLRGYQVKMNEDAELVWAGWDNAAALTPATRPADPIHFAALPATSRDMSLLVLTGEEAEGEIGVYSGDRLVGSGVLSEGRAGVAVRGDDPTTKAIDGAAETSPLRLMWWDERIGEKEVAGELIRGKLNYYTDEFTAIRVTAPQPPRAFALLDAYPNPFNAETRLTFSLGLPDEVELSIYDLEGRQIAVMLDGEASAGVHHVTFDAKAITSGVYFVRLEASQGIRIRKLTLIR